MISQTKKFEFAYYITSLAINSIASEGIALFCFMIHDSAYLLQLVDPLSCKKVDGSMFISFHTYDYARHFVSACTRILGLEGTPDGVEDQGKLTRVAAVCTFRFAIYL